MCGIVAEVHLLELKKHGVLEGTCGCVWFYKFEEKDARGGGGRGDREVGLRERQAHR